jgi:hypothetical protein
MIDDRDDLDDLLDRALTRRANEAAPLGMKARIVRSLAETAEVSMAWWRRGIVPWLATAAASLLVAAGLLPHLLHRTLPQPAVDVARVSPHAEGLPSAAASSIDAVEKRHSVHRVARPVVPQAIEAEVRPKLDMFPSTAIHPPKAAPGSREAQLQILTSLPESTLAMMAEAQEKNRYPAPQFAPQLEPSTARPLN